MNQSIEAQASPAREYNETPMTDLGRARELLRAKALKEAAIREATAREHEAQARELRAREENGVRIGQIWIDRDHRKGLRLLEIQSIENGRATCKVVHSGKTTRISTRCLPWSNKYKLLLDVINEEPASWVWTRRLQHGFQIVSDPSK